MTGSASLRCDRRTAKYAAGLVSVSDAGRLAIGAIGLGLAVALLVLVPLALFG